MTDLAQLAQLAADLAAVFGCDITDADLQRLAVQLAPPPPPLPPEVLAAIEARCAMLTGCPTR